MALSKAFIYLLVVLVSLTITCAEESQPDQRSIASQIQQMIPDFISGFSDMMGSRQKRSPEHNDRDHQHDHHDRDHQDDRHDDHHHHHNHEHNDSRNDVEKEENQDGAQQRLFFSFPVWTTCNYTTQAGRTCTSCTRALSCYANNIGRLTICRGLFPYCNGGRCSLYPGSACTNSTA